jgi:hypothetical protein
MPRGEAVGAEVAGEGEQVGELDRLVARDAGDGRSAPRIFVGEAIDHAALEAGLVVEDVMGDSEPLGDGSSVVDVAAGAAGLRAADRLAMIVELEGDSNDLGAGPGGERGHDRAVDPARHGDDDPRLRRLSVELEIGGHGGRSIKRMGCKAQPEPPVIARSEATKQSSSEVGSAGWLRFARNDGARASRARS